MKEDNHGFDKKLEILRDLSEILKADDIDLVILNKAPISLLTKERQNIERQQI